MSRIKKLKLKKWEIITIKEYKRYLIEPIPLKTILFWIPQVFSILSIHIKNMMGSYLWIQKRILKLIKILKISGRLNQVRNSFKSLKVRDKMERKFLLSANICKIVNKARQYQK